MELIKQKTSYDCAVCCLAMATGESYEAIVRNLPIEAVQDLALQMGFEAKHDLTLLDLLRFNYETFYTPNGYTPNGRKAIFMLPSLNRIGKKHAVFFDGSKVYDPANGNTYTTEEAFKNNEWVIEFLDRL